MPEAPQGHPKMPPKSFDNTSPQHAMLGLILAELYSPDAKQKSKLEAKDALKHQLQRGHPAYKPYRYGM